MLSKRWEVAPPLPTDQLDFLPGYSDILKRIVYNRGFTNYDSAIRFLNPLSTNWNDPSNLLGISQAVERIQWGIQKGEKIAVYGDYDADGVTATALLTQLLRSLGADVMSYIPNRFDEGYGLNVDALDNLNENDIKLVITVDCGIRSNEEAKHAKDIGLDLIITDHHHPISELPESFAIINPKQENDPYPYKELSGVGIAFKLAVALLINKWPGIVINSFEYLPQELASYLDLVAIGSVADLVPLTGENRALVRLGLSQIRKPHRPGLYSLIKISGLTVNRISSADIGYILGPRLNASGRLDTALTSLRLLLTEDRNEAGLLAQELEMQNRKRQDITREIFNSVTERLASPKDQEALLLVAVDSSFNPGVIGLVASRLTEKFYRPAIVASSDGSYIRGSCRSIHEFHITNALDKCAELMEHHGGHAAAAGFTIRNELFPELIKRLRCIAEKELSNLDLRPVLKADAEVAFSELEEELIDELDLLQPTGHGNPAAYLVTRDLIVEWKRTVGKDNTHLKLGLFDGKRRFNAIAFNLGHWYDLLPSGSRIDALYTFEMNEFDGYYFPQLNVKDIKTAGSKD